MARGKPVEVQVEGLRELRRALKQVEETLPRELRATNKRVVEQVVLPEARRRGQQTRLNVAGRETRLGSRGVATIRPVASQTSAGIAMGGARAPWAVGHEWGSTGRYPQFPARPTGGPSPGFILYPVVREKQQEIVAAYTAAIEPLLRHAFPE